MAVISVNYDDEKYISLELYYNNEFMGEGDKLFNSGDFIKDWYKVHKFIIDKGIDEVEVISLSSSVANYLSHSEKYDVGYIGLNKFNKPYLHYGKGDGGLKIYVKKGETPDLEEYQRYCKS